MENNDKHYEIIDKRTSESKERVGMCSKCKEYTTVEEPCCNTAVLYEGHLYNYDSEE